MTIMNRLTSNDDKVVVISGTGGLCIMQAEALLANGENVALLGRNVENTERVVRELTAKKGTRGSIIGLGGVDIRDYLAVLKALTETVAVFGKIDLVVSGTACSHLIDYNHISSGREGWYTINQIDTAGCINLAAAVCEISSVTRVRRFMILDPNMHAYGLQYFTRRDVGMSQDFIKSLLSETLVSIEWYDISHHYESVINNTLAYVSMVTNKIPEIIQEVGSSGHFVDYEEDIQEHDPVFSRF